MLKKASSIYKKYKEIINYLVVGVLTTIVSIAVFYLCRITILKGDSQIDIQISNIISWLFSVHFAFIANKRYVFESVKKGKEKIVELIKFDLSRVSTLLIEMICMWILTEPLSIDDKISKLVVQVIVIALNYVFSKLFVFTHKKIKN